MLKRYKAIEDGKLVKQAEVYTKKEHNIDYRALDQDAVRIIRRLEKAGFESYIVGGAVRDLLLGKQPKDFDIATAAEPGQIRKLFGNSRIIGKRFRLVHIFFKDQKIIEVSTFRSADSKGFNNVFGEIEEDVLRRDFSMNALYYNPVKEQLVDFVGGYRDVRAGRLQAVIPLKRIFVEDPVRLIRAVKYQVKTGLVPGYFLRRKIQNQARLLSDISSSRLTEEIYKILGSGNAAEIFRMFMDTGIMDPAFPGLKSCLDRGYPQGAESGASASSCFLRDLEELDSMVEADSALPRNIMIRQLTKTWLLKLSPWCNQKHPPFSEVHAGIKDILKPMIPANRDVEEVIAALFSDGHKWVGQRKRSRSRRPAGQRQDKLKKDYMHKKRGSV